MAAPVDGVTTLAAEAARTAGLVLEDVTITPAGRRRVLRVTVDLPEDATGGVPMDAVAAASQALSLALDASDVMGGTPYVLEVSSPGADRPLTERRHWRRACGRRVLLHRVDGGTVTGRLTAVEEAGPVLDGAVVAWSDVVRGRVELEFARPGEEDDPDGLAELPDALDDEPDDASDDELDGADHDHEEGSV